MKSYAVIGLGKFGFYMARGLAQQGLQVIAVDKNKEQIVEVSEYVENTIILDSTDIKALREAGIGNINVVIISIGENIESSILTMMAVKDLGVETIFAKALTPIHGQILLKLGATKVIYPEMESARKLVKRIIADINYETIDLSPTIKIVKLKVPPFWVGKLILSSNFEDKYEVKPIAYKHKEIWHTTFENDDILDKDDILVVLGNTQHIEELSKKA